MFPAHRTIYFPQVLKTNLLSETIISWAQAAFACLNSAIITVELSVKYIQSSRLSPLKTLFCHKVALDVS